MSGKTVFMFSGQGSHYRQMGRELFDNNAVFRESMLRLDSLAKRQIGESVVDAIHSGTRDRLFDRTLHTHPAIFMVEYSLAQCLLEAGLQPAMTLGASLGSFAAAVVAGFLEVEQAMAAVIKQAVAFEACCQRGGMIAALADPAMFEEPFLADFSELAAVNFATHFAVSAPEQHLSEIEAGLHRRNVTYQRLAVSFAFHSRWIEDAQPAFEAYMRSVLSSQSEVRGRLPLVCCEHAATLTTLPADFFWRVVRGPIRFRETIARLERGGAHRYIDCGPAGTLATFVKYALPTGSSSTVHSILTPYGRDQQALATLLH